MDNKAFDKAGGDVEGGGALPLEDNLCINAGLEDQMTICGYRKSPLKNGVTWILIVLTLGFLRLVFYWRPDWFLRATHNECGLQAAEKVLLQDQYRQLFVETVKLDPVSSSVTDPSLASQEKSFMKIQEGGETRYFVNKRVKYIWSEELTNFHRLRGLESDVPCSSFHHAPGLSLPLQAQKRVVYGSNAIVVRVTPILKLLFTQGLNPFYVFQIFSVILWYIDEYAYYATTILIISIVSLTTQIYQTRAMQRALKHTITANSIVAVCRDSGDYDDISSEDLVPGDVLEVPRHGCIMQCDAVLISGNCIVNESMLTGESVPVTKTPVPNPRGATGEGHLCYSVKEHSRHTLFCGTKVIQTRFYGKQKVKAVVIRTGFATAKGELVRSILFPKPTDFKFSQDAYKFIGVLFSISLVGMVYTYAIMIHRGIDVGTMIIRSLDLVTIVVPPALPAAMTIGIVFAQRRLRASRIFCISPNSINQCGALNVYCFDKTGTLTEDGLDMWGAVPTSPDAHFETVCKQVSVLGRRPITYAMATCHSLTIIEGELCGDPLDFKMFEATGWELEEQGEDTSKYDVFMPTVVRPKKPDVVTASETLDSAENIPFEIGILRQFTFSSKLQRMSVIARTLGSQAFDLYAKGAPEMIASRCKPETVPENFHDVLMQYTMQGYRVIALAWRQLRKMNYVKIQRIQRDEVETKLNFLGLLVMENRLKPETTPVIRELKLAAIRPVMVTGDNMLTALSVARDCHMIEPSGKVILAQVVPPTDMAAPELRFNYAEDTSQKVLEVKSADGRSAAVVEIDDSERVHFALTGKTWGLIREHFADVLPKLVVRGTVFARFSPEQKQQLIETMQDVGYYVGMCGDGANDCGALKTAHAGISLSEAEASVASPFTSKEANISCVPTVIREGRAALVTSFGIFKYMACYSLTQFFSVCLLYWIGANLTDFGFLYIDLFLLTTLSVTYGYTRAYPEIVRTPPEVSLISFQPIASILAQMVCILVVQFTAFFVVQRQPWYEAFVPNEDDDYACHLVTTVMLVSCYQYILLAVVFSKGAPYRRPIYTNYVFVVNLVLVLGATLWTTLSPMDWVVDLMELEMPPPMAFRALMVGLGAINFFTNFLLETFVVDSKASSRLQERLHRSGKHLSEHKAIENELTASSAAWPPLAAHAASLADLMRLESEVAVATTPDTSHDLTDLDASHADSELGKGNGSARRYRQVSESSFDNSGFYLDDKDPMLGPMGDNNRSPSSPTKADMPLLTNGESSAAGLGKRASTYLARCESKEDAPLVTAEVLPGDVNVHTQTTLL